MGTESSGDSVHPNRSQTEMLDELVSLGFSRNTLSALSPAINATRLVSYAAGDTLFHEGAGVDALYVIRKGRIKLLNYLENGRARIVRLHKRKSIIGLNGLLDEPHGHTAMAIDEVTLYQIPMHLIKTVTAQDAEAYSQLLEHWHEYLQLADTWITDFSTGAIRARVARLLQFLIETEEDSGPCEVVLLTVEEMAGILGVTPESVSRTMADMKRRKILQAVGADNPDRYRCDMQRLSRETDN